MKKIILPIVFSAFLLALMAGSISACDCITLMSDNPQELVEYAYRNSDAVFSGEIIKTEKIAGSVFVKVTLKVEKSWKNLLQREAVVIAENEYSDCGYNFKVGEKYLIYAQGKTNNLEVTSCTRTSIFKSNKDIDFLNKIKNSKIISSPK